MYKGSTNQETGETMGKPSRKLKKTLWITGVTGAVYLSFRYLLPLVIPFLLAYGIALLLKPSAGWLSRKLRIHVRGRSIGLPIGGAGALELLVLLLLLGTGIYFGGEKLYEEARMFLYQFPEWLNRIDVWITRLCHDMEGLFHIQKNGMVVMAREMLYSLAASVKSAAMPYLFVNSMTIFRCCTQCVVFLVILIVATMLSLQEMEDWRQKRERSIYRQEFALISRRLSMTANAYLKTQGTIMTLTMIICSIGFWLLGNPYYILGGIGIGILDAFPVFGTGTVLIPWALVSLFTGKTGTGVVLLLLYVICYFVREILEAKMMGDKVGLSPLETLAAMYVGLQLFGLIGFLLGPIGLLLIEDFVNAATADPSDDDTGV